MRIIEVCDVLDYGDGVSSDILTKAELFRELGYECEIFYGIDIDSRLIGKAFPIEKLSVQEDDIVLHHYSGYSQLVNKISALNCKKILVYHNITPPEFVTGAVREHCIKGLEQLKYLKGVYDFYIGDSQFNIQCLLDMRVTEDADVLPIVVEFEKRRLDHSKSEGEEIIFLFVGRIVQNKRIENVIDVFEHYYVHVNRNCRLLLPGNINLAPEYVAELKNKVNALKSKSKIEFLGKINDEELQEVFSKADIYISMSEHEGFGIPLLEAMNYEIPVLAYDAGAVADTLGKAGVLTKTKNPIANAYIADIVISNPELKHIIVEAQNENLNRFKRSRIKDLLNVLIKKWRGSKVELDVDKKHKVKAMEIQIQGPFESSYSLAIVNRKLALGMNEAKIGKISIFCTEGTGDYVPDLQSLKDKKDAAALWRRSRFVPRPDVAIRNMYPPVIRDLTGNYNFQAFAWEEDRVPHSIIDNFNKALDGVGTTSEFVTNALLRSGLNIPVKTIGNGVDLPDGFEQIQPYKLNTSKSNIFLHISSAFPRKGVDILLEAYFQTFSINDDVCLVIKCFPNPHNQTESQLRKLRRRYPEGPEVELINCDLQESELYGLYKAASVYVHVARGEGFGLTVAEAMLAKLPVIVCNNTGLADFCSEETALIVDYEMEEAKSHLTEHSNWASPNIETLKKYLYDFVYRRSTLDLEKKVLAAYQLINQRFSWKAVAKRWEGFINDVVNKEPKPRVAMVTTWNTKCGIAEFTKYFIEATKSRINYTIYPDKTDELIEMDQDFVKERTWKQYDEGIDYLIKALKNSEERIVHIQYNFGFFSIENLSKIIEQLYDTKKVVISFHATKYLDSRLNEFNKIYVVSNLNKAYRIIVHQEEERNNLINHDVKPELVQCINLGQPTYRSVSAEVAKKNLGLKNSLILGSYGFFLPHKGIEKTIRAVGILKKRYPDILYIASCALYPSPISEEYLRQCNKTIEELGLQNNVVLITDFLKNIESIKLLQACDCCIMAYDPTEESASGAVRFCISALRPLITTNQKIFKEFVDCSYQISDNKPELIANAVVDILQNNAGQKNIQSMQRRVENTSWNVIGKKYEYLYQAQKPDSM